MTFEYLVVQRGARHTSGHESEELTEFLNRFAADGWRLHSSHYQTGFHQILIFEREKRE